MDFDECASAQHFSKMITKYYWDRGIVDEEALADNSIRGIASLFNCYVGLSKKEFNSTLEKLYKGLTWKDDFSGVFERILQEPTILPVFISSGITEAAVYALDKLGFSNVSVIADDLGYRDDHIYGAETIVSDSLKGDIVRELKGLKSFTRIVTVGHSGGDVELIKSGTHGDRISFRDKEEAMRVADHIVDDWNDLLDVLGLVN